MSSVNMVILVGNLAADPEIKSTSQGGRIARMRLITSESYKDRDGNRKETSHGHTIVVFNERLVDTIESYSKKGQKIFIEGQLENRTWVDADEVKRYSTEVVLPRYGGKFRMLGRNGEDVGGGEEGSESGGSNNRSNERSNERSNDRSGNSSRSDDYQGGSRGNDDFDDDVPF
jgi:single-strand DNA-binding protein